MKITHNLLQILYHSFILLLYTCIFVILTWPAVLQLNTHILADGGDGLQMYWNLWWVRHAVITKVNVFTTPLLFYPQIPNLFIHSLHSFGGFLTIPFASILNDVALFNLVVIFAFAASGWGAYLLAKHITHNSWAAFVGGYIFTFSNYHFAHAEGHVNLILMQWIPVYLLFFLKLMMRNRQLDAVLAAVFLFLVLLCDQYYFLFCILASVLIFIWGVYFKTIHWPIINSWSRFNLFITLVIVTSGVYIGYFLLTAITGHIGGHNALEYGMDVFALFIPGGHWYFNTVTAPYWQGLSGNIHESSVHLGFGALILAVYGYISLQQNSNSIRYLLIILIVIFAILSLGKDLQIWGQHLAIPMPYTLLELITPFISLGGVPIRFILISILGISIFAACGVKYLMASTMRQIQLVVLLAVLIVELWPRPLTIFHVEFPPYIQFLAHNSIRKPGAVLDLVNAPQLAMLYQTLHQQPIHTGYLARIQNTVGQSYLYIQDLIERKQFATLKSEYGFRYIIAQAALPHCRLLYSGPIQVCEIISNL